ncbi:MAG TPA: hypothetical protein VIM11_15675 [Tepidisphaeraceae bacterium]|jgi:hypothetical protein
MLASDQVEEMICLVAAMDRDALIDQFRSYRATFPLDFTDEFLGDAPLDRLRHIFIGLCLQQQRLPRLNLTAAAA